jgi:kumamolisin
LGKPDPNQQIEVTLVVRRPASTATASSQEKVLALGAEIVKTRSRHLTHQEFEAKFGAEPDDLAKVESFAHEHGFTIVEINSAARIVRLSGPLGVFTKAFAVDDLVFIEGKRGRFRHHTHAISVPVELAGIVVSVFGMDTEPAARPRGSARSSAGPTFTAPQIADLYNFPKSLDGAGQCIGIIALNSCDDSGKATGGGFAASDLEAYFKMLNLPRPKVVSKSVLGGSNFPGSISDEMTLDVETAGAVTPGAEVVVYFAPNTTQGFIGAVKAAVHDTLYQPSVISISWGSEEDSAASALVDGLNDAIQDSVRLGITVCVATGDLGSADQIPPEMDGQAHVDAPGCSPFALACGGTKLTVGNSKIVDETVWNDGASGPNVGATGGGISNLFDKPAYQKGAEMPTSPKGRTGRGVPDLAGHAAVSAGYQVIVGGKKRSMGGTSAVAPLFAGLFARINQQLASSGKPHAGFVNPLLYQSPGVFRDILQGNNDQTGTLKVYQAEKGWDPCTGLGVPDGTSLLQLFTALPAQSKNSPKPHKRLAKQAT